MVRLITVSTGFEAKVIAARLGVEGILWELRGGVDGPYPIGPVHVFVAEQDLSFARQVLLESEVESAFHEPRPAHSASSGHRSLGGGGQPGRDDDGDVRPAVHAFARPARTRHLVVVEAPERPAAVRCG